MTDTAEPADPGMHDASAHASTKEDPPQLTSVAANTASIRPPRDSAAPEPSKPSRPADLTLSTGDLSSNTHNPPADAEELTPPTSAISSPDASQATESLSQPESSQSAAGTIGDDKTGDTRAGSSSQSPTPEFASGTKRTASGEVKRASVNGLGEVLAKPGGARHAHTSSTVSNGSKGNVLELSQQLRTKLKYAMVKVQNGWQTRSLDEVESLASQSPRSTVSGFQQLHDHQVLSPRTAMSRKYQRESSESDSSDTTGALESQGLVTETSQVPSRRALAPPVDIVPSSRRRPTPNAAFHAVNGSHMQSRALHSRRPPTSQRTPSQNAAMEADAVETLLFMASPNNSGYNPPSHASQESSLRTAQAFSSQTSPLRTQFSQTSVTSPKKVGFSDSESSAPAFDKAALIDRMLDELSDDSDAELEYAFTLAEKGKMAASVTS
ncbi:hypothetical protein G647_00866 [Cladophialophora carrionii CBS 160.54]|uniref:Uncharacterized protein n=1 Tax=Cladophialophora carrionii CBS 160.54 TaxID=1279043 RepID=V9DR51_9EURO|nr:uncharacterized protein G647_00866 [Cladophialophora carrionii CBS 160.54]ETI28417.1 hypothetical protein G647_00866 [Cladophialophora carrionii CBS 160.54]